MKLSEVVKLIDGGRVKKKKGFRVHFQRWRDSEMVSEYAPGENEKPMDSEVNAWKVAWKLARYLEIDMDNLKEDDVVNVYVVDESGNPVNFYANNRKEIFNRVDRAKEKSA
jgi:hypothetical protein